MILTLDANPAQLGLGRVNWYLSQPPPGTVKYRMVRNGVETYEGTRSYATDGPVWPTYTYTWQGFALDVNGDVLAETAPQDVTVPWPEAEAGGPVIGLFVDFPDYDRSDHGYLEWNAAQALEAVQLSAAVMATQSRDATSWDPVSVQYIMMQKNRADYIAEDPLGWKLNVFEDAIALLPGIDWPHMHRAVLDIAPNGEGGGPIPGTVVDGKCGTAWLVGTPGSNVEEILHEVGGHCEGWGTHAGGSTQLTPDWITPNPSIFRGYADIYDWMGLSGPPGARYFNGGERWRFGWLSQATDIQWITASGDYELAPVEVSDGRPTVLAIALDPVTIGIVEYVPETMLQAPPNDVVPAFQVRVLAGVKLDRNDETGAPGGLVDTIAVLDNPLLVELDVPWENFGGGWVVTPLSFQGDVRGTVHIEAPETGAHTLGLSAETYSLTGQALGLRSGRRLPLGETDYDFTGQALGLRSARRLPVESMFYGTVGQNLGLRSGRRLAMEGLGYGLTGQAVTLTWANPHAFTLAIGGGSYTLTGSSVGLSARRLEETPGTPEWFAAHGTDPRAVLWRDRGRRGRRS